MMSLILMRMNENPSLCRVMQRKPPNTFKAYINKFLLAKTENTLQTDGKDLQKLQQLLIMLVKTSSLSSLESIMWLHRGFTSVPPFLVIHAWYQRHEQAFLTMTQTMHNLCYLEQICQKRCMLQPQAAQGRPHSITIVSSTFSSPYWTTSTSSCQSHCLYHIQQANYLCHSQCLAYL